MEEVDKYYKKEAKDLIDLLFDKNFLNPELTRDSICWLEEYIGFLFQSKCQIATKVAILTSSLKKK